MQEHELYEIGYNDGYFGEPMKPQMKNNFFYKTGYYEGDLEARAEITEEFDESQGG